MWFWVSIFSLPTETFTMYCFNVSTWRHFIYSDSPLKPKLVSSELWLRVDVQYLHNLHTVIRQAWKSSFLFLEKYGNGLYVWNQTGWTTNLGHSRNVQQQKRRSLIMFAFYLLSSFFLLCALLHRPYLWVQQHSSLSARHVGAGDWCPPTLHYG